MFNFNLLQILTELLYSWLGLIIEESLVMHPNHDVYLWGLGIPIGILVLGVLVANIFFCLSLYSAMKKIPEKQRCFPAWFSWMILVPVLHMVFAWIMLPFGIPKSFKQHCKDHQEALAKARSLFGVGLALVILMTLSLLPYVNFATAAATLVLYIIYWVKVVKFKKHYLCH